MRVTSKFLSRFCEMHCQPDTISLSLCHGTNVWYNLRSMKHHQYFMKIHVLKFVLRFHCLASLNLKCATKIYYVYPTVSRTNTHFNHNRLRINCMHISKYTSLGNILSHRNMSSYTNSEMKMASSFPPANSFVVC